MRLASFVLGGQPSYGIVSADGVHPVTPAFAARCPDLRSVLDQGLTDELASNCAEPALPLADVSWLPPIPSPSKIVCVGLNYRKPYPVAGVSVQSDEIVIFGRHDDSLVAHEAQLEYPHGEAAQSFDYEGEIVAVIGKTARHIEADGALAHVAGYSCMNEGSVRAWQKKSIHAGKNFHASGSWGPWIVTADDAGPIEDMRLTTRVNGEPRQQTTGSQMIHDLPKLIAFISHITQLNPGDVIATGSPDGTGGARTPPLFLRPGDIVEVEVSTIGTLRNRVAP